MYPIRPPRVHVIKKLLFKILFPSLLTILFISNSYADAPKLLIAGYMANPTSTDSSYEYIQLLALENIDFSATPYAVIFTNNGTAKSSGWIAGAGLTYGFNIASGTIQAGEFAYVGGAGKLINGSGSTDISDAKWLRVIDNSNNPGDGFGNKNSSGVLGNGGSNADGFAVFDMDISNITASTIPVDAVFFGAAVGTAKPASGGYTLPTNDHYDSAEGTFGNGTNTYLFPIPKIGYFVKLRGIYNQTTTTWTTPRSSTEQSISSTAALNDLNPDLQVDLSPIVPSVLPQNITAFNPPSSATYGDSVINLSATGGGSNNPLIFASSTPEICSVTDSKLSILAAGDCKISVNQAGNASYEATPELSKTILIHKKSISAKIDNKTRIFGESNPNFTISYTGLIDGNIETPPTFNSLANTSSPVGNYPIVCDNSGSRAKNYVIESCENGVLSVEKSSSVINLSQTANYVIFGNTLTVKFTATGSPTGEITVSDGVNSCSASLAVGMCHLIPSSSGTKILTATYAGDSNYAATSQTQELKVTQVIFSRNNLTLTEGASDNYNVKLASQPAENIKLSITQNSQITSNPSSLLFTPTNWNTPQTVSLTAINDAQNQGNRTLNLEHNISAGDGAGYPTNLAIFKLKIEILDNDTPAVTYVAPSYKLTLQTSGTGKGILTGTQAGIYPQASTINLTATPDNYSEFKGWQPQTCATAFNLMADSICTAQFDLKVIPVVAKPQLIPQVTYYQFTAQTSGSGKGIISGTASGKYVAASNIELTATPDINSVFIAWNPTTCAQNFSLNADKICTAQFDLKPLPVVITIAPVVEKPIISKPVLKSENIVPVIQTIGEVGSINSDNNPCFFNSILNMLCYGAQVKTHITEITANGQLSNAIIDAPLLNQGWISDSRVTAKGEITGGTITGYLENQGIIRDIEFKGRYIKGGVLAGKIRNSSAEGYLENVTFIADSSLSGGILQGVIRGNPNAPALLENVIVKKGSVVSGVRFGKNVILEAGVIVQEFPYLPVLEKLLAIDATGKTKTTRSHFYGGISVSGKAYVQKTTQWLAEPVSVRGRIIPEPEHIGQKVDLFVYSPYFESLPNLGNNRPHYMADEHGKILLWNQKPENLIAFKTGVVLESVHELEMFVGHFIATGGLNIVFGYRLEDGTLFMIELQNGIEVTIQ